MKPHYLVIEASTDIPGIALVASGQTIGYSSVIMRDPDTGKRTESLAPAVVELLERCQVPLADIDGIICSSGPGGFTSLRGAAAFAKGICVGRGIDLYAVDTPVLVIAGLMILPGMVEKYPPSTRFIVAQEAGRGEFYATGVECVDGEWVQRPRHLNTILPEADLAAFAASNERRLIFASDVISDVLLAQAAEFVLDNVLRTGKVDVATWEPNYGRLAEAQVIWEAKHGRSLPV